MFIERTKKRRLYTAKVGLRARRRIAAILEVLGGAVAGATLNDKAVDFLVAHGWVSSVNPFDLLTIHSTGADLLLASRQLFIALLLIYSSFFIIIVPIDRWRGRRRAAVYGLTAAGHGGRFILFAGVATVALCAWPVLVHTLVDAIHPLGAMAPWRQAFFDMSWRRWQFWLFAGVLSYALIPVLEELLFRGYYQRRLAEDWGNGPAILGTACFFTFSHKQYLIANAYNVTMILSLLCLAIGLGVVFAFTRSLIPGMIAHAIINVPMTPFWQGVLLVIFAIVIGLVWRRGLTALRYVFAGAPAALCLILIVGQTTHVIASQHFATLVPISLTMLVLALVLEAIDRRRDRLNQASADIKYCDNLAE